jgi:hypothetical protein
MSLAYCSTDQFGSASGAAAAARAAFTFSKLGIINHRREDFIEGRGVADCKLRFPGLLELTAKE